MSYKVIIKVDNEYESRFVQELLFKAGYNWMGNTQPRYLTATYLYVSTHTRSLMYGNNDPIGNSHLVQNPFIALPYIFDNRVLIGPITNGDYSVILQETLIEKGYRWIGSGREINRRRNYHDGCYYNLSKGGFITLERAVDYNHIILKPEDILMPNSVFVEMRNPKMFDILQTAFLEAGYKWIDSGATKIQFDAEKPYIIFNHPNIVARSSSPASGNRLTFEEFVEWMGEKLPTLEINGLELFFNEDGGFSHDGHTVDANTIDSIYEAFQVSNTDIQLGCKLLIRKATIELTGFGEISTNNLDKIYTTSRELRGLK